MSAGDLRNRRWNLVVPATCVLMLVWLVAPQSASAYLTSVSLTDEVPSRIVSGGTAHPVEFPAGATDTDLIGLDHRPASEDLYATGSQGTLYVITGDGPFQAIQVNPTPLLDPLAGTAFGYAFQPGSDQINVIGDGGQNLFFSPHNGGLVRTGGSLAFAPGDPNAGIAPVPAGNAFLPQSDGAASTMYVIDSASDSLAVQTPANSQDAGSEGVLHTLGPLRFKFGEMVDVTGVGGFDISPAELYDSGAAVLQFAGESTSRGCSVLLKGYVEGNSYVAPGAVSCGLELPQLIESLAIVPPTIVSFGGLGYPTAAGLNERVGGEVPVMRQGNLGERVEVGFHAVKAQTDDSLDGYSGTIVFEPGEYKKDAYLTFPGDGEHVNRHLLIAFDDDQENVVLGNSTYEILVLDHPLDTLDAEILPPRVELAQVLRTRRLVVSYRCSERCGGYWHLWGKTTPLADTTTKVGGAGLRRVVFNLGTSARSWLRRQARRGRVRLLVRSLFTDAHRGYYKRELTFALRRH